jgi:hypothetical protein
MIASENNFQFVFEKALVNNSQMNRKARALTMKGDVYLK